MPVRGMILMAATMLLLVAAGCATAPSRPVAGNLPADYARFRASQVSNVDYRLEMRIDAQSTEYEGRVRIEFDLKDALAPITLDFAEGKILSLSVNGKELKPDYNGWYVTLPASSLRAGRQQVDIAFSRAYSNDGAGLYRFVDPEDGRAYVYTDFEPYQSNRLFPNFDQPDLKASYELTVDTPADWIVVSAEPESSAGDYAGGKRWVFERSARFSTYLISLHAGPWHVWNGSAGKVPLRLMARQSLARYVDAEDWLRFTKQGFEFYEKYFGIPYPFDKYDQVIVPDFLSGAMENVAAVTFSERYIKRGAYTRIEREKIANVLLHELAHMWFGDLVTMRWWNGLWLNESFANIMANVSEDANTEFREAWLTYFLNDKVDAYEADEQVITHPIELPVADTDSAFANFDDITYGKGGAVLKQLSFLLGPEVFRQGVAAYLADNAWDNTELTDFMGALSRAAGRDLDAWTQEWLFSAGVNTVAVERACDAGRLSALRLRQIAVAGGPAPRTHRLQVATWGAGGSTPDSVTPVTLSGAELELSPVPDVPCPAFVYPNFDDWAFVKVQLSEKDFAFLRDHLRGIAEPLTRAMLWRNLWEAVRDARLPTAALTAILLENLPAETDPFTATLALDTARLALKHLYLFGAGFETARQELERRLEELAWQKLASGALDEDGRRLWFDFFARIAASPAAQDRLAGLVNGTLAVPGLDLDQDRRWNTITNLNEFAHASVASLVAQESARDPSARGKQAQIAIEAVAPDQSVKERWLDRIINDTVITLSDARVAMWNLLPASQAGLGRQLQSRILDALPALGRSREQPFLDTYTGNLVQGYCDAESIKRLEDALEANREASLTVTNALKVALQDDRRCLAVKELQRQQDPLP